LTAFIWGCAFVAQSTAADKIGPLTYNCCRSLLAFLMLLPVIKIMDRNKEKVRGKDSADLLPSSCDITFGRWLASDKKTLVGGIWCGVVLTVSSFLQQTGIQYTTAGKAGFVTALYIIFVPLLSVFLGKRIPKIIWLCVILAVVGFYLLCVKEDFTVSKGDFIVLGCAVGFAGHIMVIDHFTALRVHGVKMACIQFLVAAVLSGIGMFLVERPSIDGIFAAALPILYAGILSSGVGYTLQIIAQRDTDPTPATLIMSLESVFAALAGWAFLHEQMQVKEFIGCVLVFGAVILAQLPERVNEKK